MIVELMNNRPAGNPLQEMTCSTNSTRRFAGWQRTGRRPFVARTAAEIDKLVAAHEESFRQGKVLLRNDAVLQLRATRTSESTSVPPAQALSRVVCTVRRKRRTVKTGIEKPHVSTSHGRRGLPVDRQSGHKRAPP